MQPQAMNLITRMHIQYVDLPMAQVVERIPELKSLAARSRPRRNCR